MMLISSIIPNYFLGAKLISRLPHVLMKLNKTVTEIQDWILEYVTDTEIRFFVSEYNPQKKGYYLSENVVKWDQTLMRSNVIT